MQHFLSQSFSPLSEAEVSKLTTIPVLLIPTHLLQDTSSSVVPHSLISLTLLFTLVSFTFKQARVTPLLKKHTLNPAQLEN